MGCAESIALAEVRASKQWEVLRQQLHERFDQWLDTLEQQWPEPPASFPEVTATVWNVRQQLTGSITEPIVAHVHQSEHARQQAPCTRCEGMWHARAFVCRTVDTLVGPVQVERPYFSGRSCPLGRYPRAEVVGLSEGRLQRDVPQAAAAFAIEWPYETAATLFGHLSGLSVSRERLHTVTHQVAQGLSVLAGAPSRDELDRRIAQVAAGRFRRPVRVLGLDGADVPSRPASARGRRPGQARPRARRARWRHEWREAKGFRFDRLDGERLVHVRSWYQVDSEDELGKALQQVKDAGRIPEDTVRLCVIGDGAEWLGTHVQALCPQARQVLDYYHCAAYLQKVAKAP